MDEVYEKCEEICNDFEQFTLDEGLDPEEAINAFQQLIAMASERIAALRESI